MFTNYQGHTPIFVWRKLRLTLNFLHPVPTPISPCYVAATCSKFVVSSGLRVPDAVVGNYTLQHETLNGRPSYKHTDRDLFLFHHKTARLWMFGPSFGGITAAMWIWGDVASPDGSGAPWSIPPNETCGADRVQVDLTCQGKEVLMSVCDLVIMSRTT